jgi:hypothetical protein
MVPMTLGIGRCSLGDVLDLGRSKGVIAVNGAQDIAQLRANYATPPATSSSHPSARDSRAPTSLRWRLNRGSPSRLASPTRVGATHSRATGRAYSRVGAHPALSVATSTTGRTGN